MAIYLISGLVILLAVVAVLLSRRRAAHAPAARMKSGSLYIRSPLEQEAKTLFINLAAALPGHRIFPHVNLAAFIEPKSSDKFADRARSETLRSQSTDFLICDQNLTPVAAVVFDDVLRGRRGKEHTPELLKETGIPVLSWNSVNLPSVQDIRDAISELEVLDSFQVDDSTEDTAEGGLPIMLDIEEESREQRKEPRL
jgi:hypothetical protein